MKLQFLENDYDCPASQEDIRAAKRRLYKLGIPIEDIDNMNINFRFSLLTKDDTYKIIFNKENILVTYSMYISGSDSSFLFLISRAASNEVTGINYIDTSGQLVKFLNERLYDYKEAIAAMCGINSNNIYTVDQETLTLKRVKIQFTNLYGDCVVLEDCLIDEIL